MGDKNRFMIWETAMLLVLFLSVRTGHFFIDYYFNIILIQRIFDRDKILLLYNSIYFK